MWAAFEVWMMGDPAAPRLHSPIHPLDHTHSVFVFCFFVFFFFFFQKGKEVEGGGGEDMRCGGVSRLVLPFNSASVAFFPSIFIPALPSSSLSVSFLSDQA